MSVPRNLIPGFIAALILTSVPAAVTAETETDLFEASLEQLQSMVVTARKREEILQEVPISVTALNANMIDRYQLENLADVSHFMPNVTLIDAQFTAGHLTASIRGTNFQEVEKSFESSVGVGIDGMVLGTSTGSSIELLDIESIEVLRGPQGTLYGRNTIGGTINIRRTKPTGEFGYKLNVRVGENDRQNMGLVLNLPSVAGFDTKLYGFTKRANLAARLEGFGEEDGQDWLSYGTSVLWQASNTVSVQLTLDRVEDKSNLERQYDLTLSAQDSQAVGIIAEEIPALTTCDAFGPTHPSACYAGNFLVQKDQEFDISFGDSRFPFESSMDYWNAIAEVNVDVSPLLSLVSITAYLSLDDKLIEPNVGARPLADGIWDVFWAERSQEYFQFSQELRLASSFPGSINFVAGLYYMRTKYELNGDGPPSVLATAAMVASPSPSIFFAGSPAAIYRSSQDLDAFAGFGELYFDLTERLRLTAGARLSHERKRFFLDRWFSDANTGAALPQFLFNGDDSWSEPTFRISVDYKLKPSTMAYLSWARGFRSGGFDGRAGTLAGIRDTFDPETVDSFELGLRSALWQERLRLNATAFLSYYNDKQEERLISVPGLGGIPETDTITVNAAKATIWGLELESEVSLTKRLLLRSAIGYLDAKFDKFLDPNPITGVIEDISSTAKIRRAPRWTYNLGAEYRRSLGPGTLTATLHHSYRAEHYTYPVRRQSDPLHRDVGPADSRTDIFLTYTLPHRNSDTQFITTLFIKDAFGNDVRRVGALSAGLFVFGQRAAERQWGLELTVVH